jgi:hypothetical protein
MRPFQLYSGLVEQKLMGHKSPRHQCLTDGYLARPISALMTILATEALVAPR